MAQEEASGRSVRLAIRCTWPANEWLKEEEEEVHSNCCTNEDNQRFTISGSAVQERAQLSVRLTQFAILDS